MIRPLDPSVALFGEAAAGAMVTRLQPGLVFESGHHEASVSCYPLVPGVYVVFGFSGHCYPLPIAPSGPIAALFRLDAATTTHIRVEEGGRASILTQDETNRLLRIFPSAGIAEVIDLHPADQGQAGETTTEAQNNGDHHHA